MERVDAGNVAPYGFYKTKAGKRRRYRCRRCGGTFNTTRGTAYFRLQHRRATFDEVAALSVEGMSKSAIARVKGLGWNTVARWLKRAAAACGEFSDRILRGVDARNLQGDELRAFEGRKDRPLWLFTIIAVWSRLWLSALVGRRSYKNTRGIVRDLRDRLAHGGVLLFTTDGFDYYLRVVREILGPLCLYGQVLKTRRSDRVVRVERREVRGTPESFEELLWASEDSATLNTSFVERLNLTIRQGSAYLGRRTLAHARRAERLAEHVELLRCHYNFIRPHGALKFGRETRTPAMQAGLVTRRLSFREIFMSTVLPVSSDVAVVEFDRGRGPRRAAA